MAGEYWGEVLSARDDDVAARLWRAHSDIVNGALLERWLPAAPAARLLKTDLFDEAVGSGLYPVLRRRATRVTGIDVSERVALAARARHPGLETEIADVRTLPFADGAFDVIVSNSTLDHFESRAEISRSVGELARVLAPAGTLLITLDNRLNPVVGLRTSGALRHALLRARLVPFRLGVTLGPRGLRRVLGEHGLTAGAMTAIMHAPPRVCAALAARAARDGTAYPARMLVWERLERLPTRYLTGHFVACLATR